MQRFCKRCNCETVRYKNGSCKPCCQRRDKELRKTDPDRARSYSKKSYEKNKENRIEATNAWREANKEKVRAAEAKRRSENREKYNAIAAKWRASNRDKCREISKKWRDENKDRVKENRARWSFENKEARRIIDRNRKARKRNAGGKLSSGLAQRLIILQRGKCACCGYPLGEDYHLDHIVPIALGGSNTDDNIQLLRARCNLQKQAKHPIDFMQQKGFLL